MSDLQKDTVMEEMVLKPRRENKYIPLGMARNFDQVGITPLDEAGFGGGIPITRTWVGDVKAAPGVHAHPSSRGIDSYKIDWYEELCLTHLERLQRESRHGSDPTLLN